MYSEDDLLHLSGVQHMAFCERQWALIYIEQVWADNTLTLEGKFLHERTDDPFENETRQGIRVVRAMPIVSYQLGLRGIADVVEFIKVKKHIDNITVQLERYKDYWIPYPVEYKRGRPKNDDCDVVQLAAQAIALEEMLKIEINKGYLFYGLTRRRVEIVIDNNLRERVKELAQRMHKMMAEGKTPKALKKKCSLCSLVEYCQPKITINNKPVALYIERMLNMEDE